jgi:hypothetical protein
VTEALQNFDFLLTCVIANIVYKIVNKYETRTNTGNYVLGTFGMLTLKTNKMKKLMLSALALFAFGFANAQDGGGFKAGVHFGIPMGDAGDLFTMNLGLDVAYMWDVAEDFKAGVTTGYTMYMGDEVDMGILGKYDVEDAGFIPIAGSAQYSIMENLFLGVDLGYAIYAGSEDGAEGGFYYQPKVGYQTEKIEIYLGYKGISNDGDISSFGLGAAYKF